jgi:hypothetical protein
MSTTREDLNAVALESIAERFDWDRIAGGWVDEDRALYLVEWERIKPFDEKIMVLFKGTDLVAATIKVGDHIGQAPEGTAPEKLWQMVVTAMVTT